MPLYSWPPSCLPRSKFSKAAIVRDEVSGSVHLQMSSSAKVRTCDRSSCTIAGIVVPCSPDYHPFTARCPQGPALSPLQHCSGRRGLDMFQKYIHSQNQSSALVRETPIDLKVC